jgi:polyhydroxyalkanoate synthase subunit PhaC
MNNATQQKREKISQIAPARSTRGPHPLSLHLANLWHTAYQQNPATAVEQMEIALKGIRAYQRHPAKRCLPSLPQLHRVGTATLLGGVGTGPGVVFVPSLINPSFILDLEANNSLLRWLSTQGFTPYLVDWGEPTAYHADFSLAHYVTDVLEPLLAPLARPFHLAGYCLGGLLSLGYAQLNQVKSLTLIATPWDFSGYPELARQQLQQLWCQWQPCVEAFGLLPMEMLQTAFAGLDPALSLEKFTRFARLDPGSAAAHAFVALEDWANQGSPLSKGAARDCFEAFFQDNLTAKLDWHVGGQCINPAMLRMACLCLTSQTDRLVPPAACEPLAHLLKAGQHRSVAAGHVGMIAGSKARALIWEPLAHFLQQAS